MTDVEKIRNFVRQCDRDYLSASFVAKKIDVTPQLAGRILKTMHDRGKIELVDDGGRRNTYRP